MDIENGAFLDKFQETACGRNDYDSYHYMEYYNITEKHITCLKFQGGAALLIKVCLFVSLFYFYFTIQHKSKALFKRHRKEFS